MNASAAAVASIEDGGATKALDPPTNVVCISEAPLYRNRRESTQLRFAQRVESVTTDFNRIRPSHIGASSYQVPSYYIGATAEQKKSLQKQIRREDVDKTRLKCLPG